MSAAGDLLTCQHQTRSVTRTFRDGTVSTLVERYQGRRFNSPNDVVVDRHGVVWFTDPPYGLEGGQATYRVRELPGNYVFRFDPETAELDIVAENLDRPNGLTFSPDEKLLFIADSGMLRGQGADGNEIIDVSRPHHIRKYLVVQRRRLVDQGVFAEIDCGAPDGIRVDRRGNVWSSAGDGVHVFNFAGKRIARLPIPEVVGNIAFDDKGRLFATASTSLYSIEFDA